MYFNLANALHQLQPVGFNGRSFTCKEKENSLMDETFCKYSGLININDALDVMFNGNCGSLQSIS